MKCDSYSLKYGVGVVRVGVGAASEVESFMRAAGMEVNTSTGKHCHAAPGSAEWALLAGLGCSKLSRM